ncbi:MAG: CoA transferase [Burkholderiales bacterium]|nr:CoA transferase [Burkholderiales bacterium]
MSAMTGDPAGDGALAGLRVLDLGHQIAGPYCARLLADQGAEVIKVERPGTGDVSRAMGPYAGGEPHPEKSLTFLYLNYNKRSLTLDLKKAEGRRILLALAQQADVLVENFEPRVMPSLGLDHAALSAANPGLVLTSISNFGQTGPRRDWRGNDLIDYALSGIMSISGTALREPVKHGYHQAGYVGGLAGVIPTLAALLMRDTSGRGQQVDVAIAEALTSTLLLTVPYYTYMGETQTRRAPVGDSFGNCARARDGWVVAHAPRSGEWNDFCEVVGAPLLADPKFATTRGKIAHAAELDRLLGAALAKQDRFALFEHANRKKILFGVVQTPQDLANCPQLAERGFFHEIDHPVAGRLRYPGQTFEGSEEGFRLSRRPPLLGEHTGEILRGELGCSAAEVARLRAAGVV